MRKILIIFIAICAIFCTSSYSQNDVLKSETPEVPPSLTYLMQKSTVAIFSIGNKTGICTGVLIENSKDYSVTLTAKHCTGTFEEVYIDNELSTYTSVSNDDDLAIVVAPRIKNKVAVDLARKQTNIGDKVYHLGYPSEGELVSGGNIKRKSKDWQYGDYHTISGCSGGGVFNVNGELVGINWGMIRWNLFTDKGLSILEPLSDVKRFLDMIKQPYTTR